MLKDLKLSKYKLPLNSFDTKTLIFSFISFLFLLSYFGIGIFSYKKELKNIELKKEELKKYHLPLTTFQLNSIYSNLKEIDLTQKKLKKDLEFISKTPLNSNEFFKKISFDKIFEVEIKTNRSFDNYFSRHFKIISSKLENKTYYAKLSDE